MDYWDYWNYRIIGVKKRKKEVSCGQVAVLGSGVSRVYRPYCTYYNFQIGDPFCLFSIANWSFSFFLLFFSLFDFVIFGN